MSEELGDLLMPADVNMALTVYQRANVPEKVINCLMQKGESDKIVAYSTSVGYRVDYTFMLQQLVRTNPQGALDFAKKLVSNETGPQLIDVNAALEIFLAANLVREGTAFLLEALKGNKKVRDPNLLKSSFEIISSWSYFHYNPNLWNMTSCYTYTWRHIIVTELRRYRPPHSLFVICISQHLILSSVSNYCLTSPVLSI